MAVPKAPGRDGRLDALRGYLQLVIFASHSYGSFIGAWLIPAAWGLSDSSEQFLFLSGLALGSVFSRKRARDGLRAALLDLGLRIVRLWRTHLVVFSGFALMVLSVSLLLGMPSEVERMGFGHLLHNPLSGFAGAAVLLYQPNFQEILPVFIWCMMLLPGFVLLLARAGGLALILPVLLWGAVQLWGWNLPSLGGSGIGFNPLAWQILFMTGAWIGRRALFGAGPLPGTKWITAAAILVLAGGLWFRLIEHGFLAGPAPGLGALTAKDSLGPLRLLHAFATSWIAVRVLPAAGAAIWRHPLSGALGRIGRHSLMVFCVGLFLSYAAATLFRTTGHGWGPMQPFVLDVVLIGAGTLLLSRLARWLDRAPEGAGRPMKAPPSAVRTA
ncbi:hypothetical protein C8P66_103113 [Humitalea rosea]|uniref:OpgC protein n=2 Tax=Humitalea rosea TaxID=990373 RepID=A0A2W7IPD2_9PROT|nr:hypothetical protein C8P66_103113 [Humitalea rosea]